MGVGGWVDDAGGCGGIRWGGGCEVALWEWVGGVGGTIGLIFRATYAHMYFFVNLVKKLDSS